MKFSNLLDYLTIKFCNDPRVLLIVSVEGVSRVWFFRPSLRLSMSEKAHSLSDPVILSRVSEYLTWGRGVLGLKGFPLKIGARNVCQFLYSH